MPETDPEWLRTRSTGAGARSVGIISTLVVVLVLLLASAVQASGDSPATTEYRVRSGDTLWSIAATHGPEREDVRDVIESIRRANDLDGSLIHPGQVLEIPALP